MHNRKKVRASVYALGALLMAGGLSACEKLLEAEAHCRESLAAYKVPKVVQFYDELPKTNVGKILRRELR